MLPVSYYRDAVAEIVKNYSGDITFYVFSEDVAFANELLVNLNQRNMRIMPIRENYEDLFLMSMAKHHIIANSSFSWWGAVLSKKEDGIVIAPKRWFNERCSPDLYFDDWVII